MSCSPPSRTRGSCAGICHPTWRWELRAWAHDTWTKLGVDPDQVAQAVIGCWQDGEVSGCKVDDLSFEEARSLTRPAMTYVRGQLRGRLTARLGRAYWRWLHPTSGRQPGDRFL
jgi:hypothetical protein